MAVDCAQENYVEPTARQPSGQLSGELSAPSAVRSPDSFIAECVKQAAKNNFVLNWDAMKALPPKFVSEYDEDELLQAKFQVSDFLLSNRGSVFSEDVISNVSPAAIVLGGEGSGKSSTVAGIIGRPVTFTAPQTEREDVEYRNSVGSRCPTKITVTRVKQLEDDVITVRGLDRSVVVPGVQGSLEGAVLTPLQASDAVQQHMLHIWRTRTPGISSEPISLTIKTSQSLLPLTCFDMPGMVGFDHREKEPFSRASEKLTADLVREWVFNGTGSRAFAVISAPQQLKSGNWIQATIVDGQFISDKVAWVLTHVDKMDMEPLRSSVDDTQLENRLLGVMSGSVVDSTRKKTWPDKFFLVCNADMKDSKRGVTAAERYMLAQEEIYKEVCVMHACVRCPLSSL